MIRTRPQPGFYLMFQRYFDAGLAQASYLLACDRTREAVVIDPRRDVDVYLVAGKVVGWVDEVPITHDDSGGDSRRN